MIAGVVREAAKRFRDKVAVVAPDGEATYLELYHRTEAAAAWLAERDIGEHDVVALDLPSSLGYVVAYLAAARVGAITAGVNPRFGEDERRRVIDRAQPSIVLDEPIPEDFEPERHVPKLPLRPDRAVAIVFTSGTTGEPKGAVFRNRELAAITMFDSGGAWGSPDEDRPMLSSTEMCHVGFMTKLPWYLRTGSRIHVLQKWRAEDALRTISEQRMPSVGGIGAQIALMLRLPDFDSYDTSSVKAIIVGGGPSPKPLIEEARRRFGGPGGAAYSVRYSSTESGGVGTLTAFDAPEEETLYTVGRPREGIDLVIRDEQGAEVPQGEVGEVTLRSPAMMVGYWNDPDATAAALRDGWLYTQDLGWIDERGCLRLAGRSKEMYIRGGYNVYPLEVEALLSGHPDVAHVAVVPRPDDVMGEIGVAVVVPRDPQAPPTLDDLRSFLSGSLAPFKLPEAVHVVAELPYTGMQKVDRRALEAAVVPDGPSGT